MKRKRTIRPSNRHFSTQISQLTNKWSFFKLKWILKSYKMIGNKSKYIDWFSHTRSIYSPQRRLYRTFWGQSWDQGSEEWWKSPRPRKRTRLEPRSPAFRALQVWTSSARLELRRRQANTSRTPSMVCTYQARSRLV